MHSSFYLWKFIQDKLIANTAVVLMYVLESNGSSPGRQGFGMAVAADGAMHGSIGGGIMEHKFVEMCREICVINQAKPELRIQVHDKSAAKNQSGMICSGDQTIFIYPVRNKDISVIDAIVNCLKRNANATLRLAVDGIQLNDDIPIADFIFSRTSETSFAYEERLGYKHFVSVIGGGHCALALTRMLHQLDFYIRLYDDREGLNTMMQNSYAHHKQVVNTYDDLNKMIAGGSNEYLVIMTFGYRTDDTAIRALIGKQFKYFGVLGSTNKIKKLFSDYIAEGFDEQLLSAIKAPIGLPINSRTPEEIAVSIAAEIIQVKNKS